MASTRANYVKIGVFVSLAVTIAIIIAIVLGAGAFNKAENLMETYIEESVQGLDVGSAVKFRGIPIGKIKEISFVWPTYDTPDTPEGRRAMRYARIVFTIDNLNLDNADNLPFTELIDEGLRVYVKSQGITGLMYLNMDFATTPFARATLPVPWKPKYPYIPSASGLHKAIFDVIDNLSEQLSGIDFRSSLTSL
ncbi:MAG: MCE family protein, partial [Lentisphaerae bacterium]|nr:MCE family protein [Lentisphaerota bacterium]